MIGGTDVAKLRRQLVSTVIRTKKSLSGARIGQFRTVQRGSGSDFDQLRDYMPGDDIRFIDWKSSARTERLVLRQYRDERSRVLIAVVDASASMNYGTSTLSALEAAYHIAAILTVIAELSGDAVGLYIVTDKLECLVPPAVGTRQTEAVIEACTLHNLGCGRGFCKATFQQLKPLMSKRSFLFCISDFAQELDYGTPLLPFAAWHACYAVRMRTGCEASALTGARFMKLSTTSGPRAVVPALESPARVLSAEEELTLFWAEQERLIKRAQVHFFDCLFAQEERLLEHVMHGLHLAVR